MMLRVLLLLSGVRFMLQDKPTLTPDITIVIENNTLELTCNVHLASNKSRWSILDQSDQFSYLTFVNEGVCITSGFLAESKQYETMCYSNSTFKVQIKQIGNRNHGQQWFCSYNYVKSNIVRIYVQVPTKFVAFKYISGDVIDVVEKMKTTVICETSAGRPAANITWIHISKAGIETYITHNAIYNVSYREIPLSESNLTKVQSSIDIVPLREDNDTRIVCKASNRKHNKVKKEVTLRVQYPPSKPIFYVDGTAVNGSLPIMSGSNVSILCKSDSFPSLTYHWTSTGRSEDGPYLNLSNIDKNETWQCTSTNNMALPNKTIPWEISANITIYIFYPSEIDRFYVIGKESGDNVEATENETIIFHCSVKSIPKSEIVLKFGENELRRNEYTQTLNESFRVTSCLDDGVYTCEAKNQYNSQPSSKELRVSVKCSADRLYFMISEIGLEGNRFIVNSNEEISLTCFSCNDLPFSSIVMRRQDGKQLTLMKNTTSITHKIHKVACYDAGIYICSAKETSLSPTQNAISKLTLIVKCPPAPATKYKGDETILSVLHSDVTLQFEVLEFYDEINKTVFMWYKQNISLPNDGRKYIITSYGLQSNLVIRNIAVTDFGQYKVVVFNSYGQYIHHFKLDEKVSQPEKGIFESTTARILLVAVGTFGFIIVVGVVVAIHSRRIRRRRSDSIQMGQIEMSTDAVANQIPSIEDDNVDDVHYQEINVYEHLDQHLTEREEYVEIQSITSEDSNKYYITPIHY